MSFDDIVSLLIAIIAMLFMVTKTIKAERKTKREEEQGYENEEEELFEEEEELPLPPPPKPKPIPVQPQLVKQTNYEFHPKMDAFNQKSSIEDRKLTIHLRPEEELVSDKFRDSDPVVLPKKTKRNIGQLIQSLPPEKVLFLSYEVFQVPVSKRKSPFPWNG